MPEASLSYLLSLMRRLRDPQRGSEWERQQTLATLAPYTLEEAYEVVAAIEAQDLPSLCDELGDLLLQIVFQAQLAAEMQAFDFSDVVAAIVAKLERRHPGLQPGAPVLSAAQVDAHWQKVKQEERQRAGHVSHLAGIAATLPAALRSRKLQARVAGLGLGEREPLPLLAALRAHMEALEKQFSATGAADKEILGEAYFDFLALAEALAIDPEQALRAANGRFTGDFHELEAYLAAQHSDLSMLSSAQLRSLWRALRARPRQE